MKTFSLICVGKLKETSFKEIEKEYIKRLSPWITLEVIELREVPFHEKSHREDIIKKEGTLIEKQLQSDDLVIALDKDGDTLSSELLAQSIQFWMQSYKRTVFIIGGPLGLSSEIRKKARYVISLSSLTFTHQFARIILEEQLYRGFMIMHKKPYHY